MPGTNFVVPVTSLLMPITSLKDLVPVTSLLMPGTNCVVPVTSLLMPCAELSLAVTTKALKNFSNSSLFANMPATE